MLWLMELWVLLVCVQRGGTSQQDTCPDSHSPATGHILPPSHQNVSSGDGLQHETLFQHTPTVDPWDQLLPTSCPPQSHEPEFPAGKWSNVKQHQNMNKAAGQTKLNKKIPISINGSEVKLGSRNEWQSGLSLLVINDKRAWKTYELKICYDKI